MVLVASSATANIVVKKFLVLLIYILGKPLDEMAFSDQSHTEHLGHSHLWMFQHGRQTCDIDTVCNVNEAELDLRLIIDHESHLDQSQARYPGQSYTKGPSHFP